MRASACNHPCLMPRQIKEKFMLKIIGWIIAIIFVIGLLVVMGVFKLVF